MTRRMRSGPRPQGPVRTVSVLSRLLVPAPRTFLCLLVYPALANDGRTRSEAVEPLAWLSLEKVGHEEHKGILGGARRFRLMRSSTQRMEPSDKRLPNRRGVWRTPMFAGYRALRASRQRLAARVTTMTAGSRNQIALELSWATT